MNLAGIVSQLRSERERLTKELNRVDGALKAISDLTGTNGASRPRRAMSASARKRIVAAQKKRWAKWRRQRGSR